MSQNQKKNQFSPADPASAAGALLAAKSPDSQYVTEAILQAAAGVPACQSLRLEIDVPADVDCPLRPQLLMSLVRGMLMSAVECAQEASEILITVCSLGETFEVEVADDGPALQFRQQRFPMVAAAAGAELIWQDCPQGGVAVTAVMRRQNRRRLAA